MMVEDELDLELDLELYFGVSVSVSLSVSSLPSSRKEESRLECWEIDSGKK